MEQAVGQRPEDRAGIRQPDVEAEAAEYCTNRMPRGIQNPNRAKVDIFNKRVCDYTKNGKGCTCVAGECTWHWPARQKKR